MKNKKAKGLSAEIMKQIQDFAEGEGLKAIEEMQEMDTVKKAVKDNKLYFTTKGESFRVRMPSQLELEKIEEAKMKKHVEMMKQDHYLTRNQWIKLYKEKGVVDIEELQEKIENIKDVIQQRLLKLAQLKQEKDIELLKKEIGEKRIKLNTLLAEKVEYLRNSIEDKLMEFVNNYTCYIVLECQTEDDKWERYFKTYEEYLESDDWTVLNQALYWTHELIYGLRDAN